jgi:ribosomal protein L6P/L9E
MAVPEIETETAARDEEPATAIVINGLLKKAVTATAAAIEEFLLQLTKTKTKTTIIIC